MASKPDKTVEEVDLQSKFAGKTISEWLLGMDSDEQRKEFLRMMTYPEERAELQKTLTRADVQRAYKTPKGRMVRGNIYTAANPLEHLAEGLRSYQGGKEYEEAKSRLGEVQENVRGGMDVVAESAGPAVPPMGAPQGIPNTQEVQSFPMEPQPMGTPTPIPDDSQVPVNPQQQAQAAALRTDAGVASGEIPTASSIPPTPRDPSMGPTVPNDPENLENLKLTNPGLYQKLMSEALAAQGGM